ncbi:HAD family hydrolase [Arthrobacter sp. PAMC25284]|uniref:HAD family hydrolase n=1 Tax=Arthrobacter sp. PAMC25284 TaxID=2861279 RepID=UPI001C630600|nr:HAD family hydrolase [Arthrobacter sp. PAMC25284]QYF88684.1 HAD family hydrolase [Arthrobacter sp. PAMC25284]
MSTAHRSTPGFSAHHSSGAPTAPVMVASDLDRTLIYSANSMGLAGADNAAPRMVVSEVYDAAPLSFMTRAAEDLLAAIKEQSVFVPVTTRTQAQFSRVRLPGRGRGYAVTTNGAVLLRDGEPDPDWSRHIRRSLKTECAPLREVLDRLTGQAAVPAILRVRTAEDIFAYSIVDRQALPAGYTEELEEWCRARGWTTSLQGRKLYCVPVPVTKEAAVDEVRRRTGAGLLVAAGDSRLDAGILELADIAIRPAHGELHNDAYTRPNLTVTEATGILAGEEILRIAHGIVGQSAEPGRSAGLAPSAV